MPGGVVIVGAGQAGFECASTLRADGYRAPITIVNQEGHLPYQRPPLSKAFLLGKQEMRDLELRPVAYYGSHDITLIADRVLALRPDAHQVVLASGRPLNYEALVLAVGGRPRTLPVDGASAHNLCYLRTIDDAQALRKRLSGARDVVVIGGGFIGLECAAVAAALGMSVTVVESQPRLMARAVAPMISDFFLRLHEARGVTFALGATVARITVRSGRATAVQLTDGRELPADVVIVGVGIVPNAELAADAGLRTDNGIVVDASLQTSAPDVYAIGDCANHPSRFAAGSIRLESVQNASDQARCAAAGILGRKVEYRALPWFWTDQYDMRLQMAGLSEGYEELAVRGDADSHKFSVYYFKNGGLVAVDSINKPADHIVARRLLTSGRPITTAIVADTSVDLKTYCS